MVRVLVRSENRQKKKTTINAKEIKKYLIKSLVSSYGDKNRELN